VIRRLGFLLWGIGAVVLAWVAVTLVWGDPVTSLYTRHEQHVLAGRLETVERGFGAAPLPRPARVPRAPAVEPWRSKVRAWARTLEEGDPIGRIVVRRLDLNMIVVQGTGESQLAKGPGHYDAATARQTSLPGLGGVIAVAGHRTTYLHPFLHIDSLRRGDAIVLEMPYGTFTYRVTGHRVVLPSDWTILRHRPYEELVLTACHPLYSASHRYVVFARLQKSVLHVGRGSPIRPTGVSAAGRG
jgi:sortase A